MLQIINLQYFNNKRFLSTVTNFLFGVPRIVSVCPPLSSSTYIAAVMKPLTTEFNVLELAQRLFLALLLFKYFFSHLFIEKKHFDN